MRRLPSSERLLCLLQLPAERIALGLQPRPCLRASHGGLLRPRLPGRQFGAQIRHRLLALLAQRAFLVDLAQRAALGGAGALLRHHHLLAGALQVRRELRMHLAQLPLQRLDLTPALLLARLRGRVGLALGVQLPL
ncbi:hypothetical protein [Cupriavidus basilensis]|uniref:hypothetical protein n=1 Tax=Cupriavidus basilensis TaxID=68895 RepID=UPI0039F6659B